VAWFLIAAALKKPFKIFGNGKQVRDLLWIDDLCDLYLKFWNSDTFPWGTPVNAGGGLNNCLSLIELIEKMRGLKIKFNEPAQGGWRKGDQKIFCSNNSLAKKLLGWHPSTQTSTGIKKLVNWILENKDEIQKLLESKN
jgi:CDP-paratose 2-epimerase